MLQLLTLCASCQSFFPTAVGGHGAVLEGDAVLQSFNQLGTLQQRLGNRSWNVEAQGADGISDEMKAEAGIGLWGRIEGTSGSYDPESSTTGTTYNTSTWRLQTGADILLSDSAAGQLIGGVVTFRHKDYRRDGADRQQVMALATDEFIRRFLLHVLPHGFHRIRHYGILAGSARKASLAHARELLDVAAQPEPGGPDEPDDFRPSCPCCGGRMIVIETFGRWGQPRRPPDATATNRENVP
ncbi:transposase [Mesorhizobium sp. URHB0026]